MPFQSIPGTDQRFALISFDDKGRERTDDPDGGVFSRTVHTHVAQTQPSHIFFFVHGWKGDFPAAIDQYNQWIGAMWKREAERVAMGPGFRPLFIGLHWPSQPWGEETIGAAASFSTSAGEAITAVLYAAGEHFGGGVAVRVLL